VQQPLGKDTADLNRPDNETGKDPAPWAVEIPRQHYKITHGIVFLTLSVSNCA